MSSKDPRPPSRAAGGAPGRDHSSSGAGPPRSGRRRKREWGLALVLAGLLIVSAVILGPDLIRPGSAGAGPGQGTTVRTTLELSPTKGGTVGPGFLGVNVRADASFGAYEEGLLTGTSADLLRWPGGALADRYNGTALGGQGVLYNDDGSNTTAPVALTDFATWCLSVQCSVIYTLPAEIADPSVAAYTVAWIEGHLGLHPTYWEVGNEPALWTHFGIPWSNWSTSQAISPTSTAYASLAESYAIAIHRVDPSARILGLGGLGKGAASERTWINATLTDGAQGSSNSFAGVAVHVYPAGGGFPGETDEQVYASLQGSSSVTSRLGADWASVRSVCASCVLLADEVGAGSGSALSPFMSGFPMVSFVAAEVIQGMEANATSLDYFVLEGGYPGAWSPSSGSNTRDVYGLYQALLPKLGRTWWAVQSSTGVPGLFAIATTGILGGVLVVVNCDQNRSVQIDLSGSGFPLAPGGAAWWWGATNTTPSGSSWAQDGPGNWTLPPEGVLLLQSTGALQRSLGHPFPPGRAGAPRVVAEGWWGATVVPRGTVDLPPVLDRALTRALEERLAPSLYRSAPSPKPAR